MCIIDTLLQASTAELMFNPTVTFLIFFSIYYKSTQAGISELDIGLRNSKKTVSYESGGIAGTT